MVWNMVWNDKLFCTFEIFSKSNNWGGWKDSLQLAKKTFEIIKKKQYFSTKINNQGEGASINLMAKGLVAFVTKY